jgi:succinyl-CoA synthetase beta subunit
MDIEAVAHDTPEKIITRHDRSGDRRSCRTTAARRQALA